MRLGFLSFLIVILTQGYAHAQDAAACKDLDLTDAPAIKACLEDDPWYEARTKAVFEPNKECPKLQLQIVKRAMEAVDLQASRRMNSSTVEDGEVPLPSCQTASEVVELIRGRPSSWTACLGYDDAEDKFEHFKSCITSFTMARHGITDAAQSSAHLSGLDCKRAVFTYRQALGLIHLPRKTEGPDYGQRLPASYEDPNCEEIVAFLQDRKDEAEAERAERYAQAEAYKAEQKRLAEEKAKENALRAQKTAELYRKLEEGYQLSYQKMNSDMLEAKKASIDPRDSLENKHLLFALAKQIWAQVPPEENEMGSVKARLFHTSNGFRTWMNVPMAPEIIHGVTSVNITNCNVKNGRANCAYDAVVSTQVVYTDSSNQQRADLYSKFATALVGPRTYSWKSDLVHDGKQWNVVLTNNQKKLLLPPEIDMSSSQSANEKTQCDLMSAMGIPMLC